MKKLLSAALASITIAMLFTSCGTERGFDKFSQGEDSFSDKSVVADEHTDSVFTEKTKDNTTSNDTNVNNTPETQKSSNILTAMNHSQIVEVNKFLSNFSEAYYGEYPDEEISDKISFAFIHNRINGSGDEYINGKMGISVTETDRILTRFFGSSVPHESTSNGRWICENGYFLTEPATGETYDYFSIATEMTENEDGTYTVGFNIYFDPDNYGGGFQSEWYSYNDEQARQNCDYLHSGEAVIREKTYNNSATYELVAYKVFN